MLPLTELQLQLLAERQAKQRREREALAAAEARLADQRRRDAVRAMVADENEVEGGLFAYSASPSAMPLTCFKINDFHVCLMLVLDRAVGG